MITEQQKQLVQESWAKVAPISEVAAGLFYNRLFELDPALKPLFSTDITEQGRKLMQTMSVVVKGLPHLEALIPAVQELGRRHSGYGVKEEHYGTVGSALIWTLEKGLDHEFTAEVKDAWLTTYTLLANTMKSAASPSSNPMPH